MNSYRFIVEGGNNLVCFLKTLPALFIFPVPIFVWNDLIDLLRIVAKNTVLSLQHFSNFKLFLLASIKRRYMQRSPSSITSIFARDNKQPVLYEKDQLVPAVLILVDSR